MFVGRLDASQKGLDTFLQAIEFIEAAARPSYTVWLVGGGLGEASALKKDLAHRAPLLDMMESGRLVLWSRVAHECLPELYSRVSIAVVPSRRESFGLVAIEAMACGAPVIAGKVGGLRDTVLHRRTGSHFKPGDAYGLSAILLAWLRNAPLRRYLGKRANEWAGSVFGHCSTESGLSRILRRRAGDIVGTHPIETPNVWVDELAQKEITDWFDPVDAISPIGCGMKGLYRVERSSGSFLVSRFSRRPSTNVSVYRLAGGLRTANQETLISRSIVGACQPGVLTMTDHRSNLLKLENADPILDPSLEHVIQAYSGFSGQRVSTDLESKCRESLSALQDSPLRQTLDRFDCLASELNSEFNGARDVFTRCHPGAELIRLRLHLNPEWLATPACAIGSLTDTLDHIIGCAPCFSSLPLGVQLGDARANNLLSHEGQTVVRDTRSMRFVFGALDLACLLMEFYSEHNDNYGPGMITLTNQHATSAQRDSALMWCIVQLLHSALEQWSWGEFSPFAAAENRIASLAASWA